MRNKFTSNVSIEIIKAGENISIEIKDCSVDLKMKVSMEYKRDFLDRFVKMKNLSKFDYDIYARKAADPAYIIVVLKKMFSGKTMVIRMLENEFEKLVDI